jgi:poly-gamma-glutamate synthesis protein (capsule biosynthesis protein)
MKLTRRSLLLAGTAASRMFAPPVPPEIRVLCAGDVMLTRYVGIKARAANDPLLPWRDVADAMRAADLAFVNLESPFTDKARPNTAGMVFRAAPDMIDGLLHAGVDVVSTANNHARDCGEYGVKFTWELLDKAGIAAAGTGLTQEKAHEGVVLERRGTLVGFLGYTYDQANGNWPNHEDRIAGMDVKQMVRDVTAMRQRADVVIVSMHAGAEYWTRTHPTQVTFARAAIEAGASAVIGHHPHVVQPWELYRDGVIFYSLGNFIFDQDRKETHRGLAAELYFRAGRLTRARAIAVEIVGYAPRFAGEGTWVLGGPAASSASGA